MECGSIGNWRIVIGALIVLLIANRSAGFWQHNKDATLDRMRWLFRKMDGDAGA